MKRRDFIVGTAAASAVGISGCAGSTNPEMEFGQFVVPDPRATSLDTNGDEYFATIQNIGDDGSVRIELWYYQDSDVPNPSAASMYTPNPAAMEGRHFDLARTLYFDAEERREISILADDGQPFSTESSEFGIMPWPASHGAVFENTGSAGEIEFRFQYRDTQRTSIEEPTPKLETVGSDTTIEVIFDTVVPPGAEYEIYAEQV